MIFWAIFLLSGVAFGDGVGEVGKDPEMLEKSRQTRIIDHGDSLMIESPFTSGIQNAGNTCFMASALQVLFGLADLRQTILDLSDDLKELEGEEAGYWAAPSTIRALQSIFTRLALDRVTAGGSIAIVPNLIKEFPTLGLIFGEPNDGMSAIDAFLDKLPEALKRPLKLDAVAVEDSIIVTPYYIQLSCKGALMECMAGKVFLIDDPKYLTLRLGRQEECGGTLVSDFRRVDFPETFSADSLRLLKKSPLEDYRLLSILVNNNGGHYTSHIRNDLTDSWFLCDDAMCREMAFKDIIKGPSITHGVQFVYEKIPKTNRMTVVRKNLAGKELKHISPASQQRLQEVMMAD